MLNSDHTIVGNPPAPGSKAFTLTLALEYALYTRLIVFGQRYKSRSVRAPSGYVRT